MVQGPLWGEVLETIPFLGDLSVRGMMSAGLSKSETGTITHTRRNIALSELLDSDGESGEVSTGFEAFTPGAESAGVLSPERTGRRDYSGGHSVGKSRSLVRQGWGSETKNS